MTSLTSATRETFGGNVNDGGSRCVADKKSTPTTTGDPLPAAVAFGVPGVVVCVARQHHARHGAQRPDDLAVEEADGVVLVRVAAGAGVDPRGCRRTEDDLVAFLHAGQGRAEVVELWRVDVAAELGVDGNEPPAVREFDREVAAALLGFPAADVALLGEDAQERRQAVVPVVVAWQGEERRRVRRFRQGGAVRALGAILVRRRRSGRVHLIAAHHQQVGARQGQPVDGFDRGRGKHRGNGVRRVETVADVGDEVEPQLVGAVPVPVGGQTNSAARACRRTRRRSRTGRP